MIKIYKYELVLISITKRTFFTLMEKKKTYFIFNKFNE